MLFNLERLFLVTYEKEALQTVTGATPIYPKDPTAMISHASQEVVSKPYSAKTQKRLVYCSLNDVKDCLR